MNYKSAQHFYVKFLAAAIGNNVMIDNRCKHHTENYLTMIILVKQVVCSNKLNAYHNIMSYLFDLRLLSFFNQIRVVLLRSCLFDEHPAVSASWPLLKINEVAVFAFFQYFPPSVCTSSSSQLFWSDRLVL